MQDLKSMFRKLCYKQSSFLVEIRYIKKTFNTLEMVLVRSSKLFAISRSSQTKGTNNNTFLKKILSHRSYIIPQNEYLYHVIKTSMK